MHIFSRARLCGAAAVLGGLLWMLFWTFHTLAHGPENPAPTDGTFLGLRALEHASIMMLVSPPFLLLGLGGIHHRLRSELGLPGHAGAGLVALSLGVMVLVSSGVGPWMLYAASVAGLCSGLLLLGAAMLRSRGLPPWSRAIPLAVALALPAIVLARAPASPLLRLGDAAGYFLLESLGVVFGLGWIALGIALRSAHSAPVPRP
jgi:hypothetical protein